ncbi:MAG: Uma2 family endonuclease [Cyanobacteria bacterium P01_F01_bin.150]
MRNTDGVRIEWKKLPADFELPDDPVDNLAQPALAAALTDSLNQAGLVSDTGFTMTNYGLCADLNGHTVVKAPDWAYVDRITVPREDIVRSYTPYLEGDTPCIVIEFLSETPGGEYSVKPTHPPGKWYFYEAVLKVPYYVLFEPTSGDLEVYSFQEGIVHKNVIMENNGRYWIESMQLFLGVWQGDRQDRSGYWLRWWDKDDNLLLWGFEKAEQEAQRAEQAENDVEKLREQLRAAGIEPDV